MQDKEISLGAQKPVLESSGPYTEVSVKGFYNLYIGKDGNSYYSLWDLQYANEVWKGINSPDRRISKRLWSGLYYKN